VDGPETAYNDRVVAFLRQPNIFDVLREKTSNQVSILQTSTSAEKFSDKLLFSHKIAKKYTLEY
jgi:hypothetical protein